MFQKGGSSRSNRLRLLPFDKVEHALRRALLRYVQIAQLATHARYLHALQCTRGFVNPQTTGFGFSKQWVLFHKTTRIFFEGFRGFHQSKKGCDRKDGDAAFFVHVPRF